MKKTILLALAIFSGTVLFSQEKKVTPKIKAPKSSVDTCYADKTWKLKKTEKFGVEKDPNDQQKNDFLFLKGDHTFKLMINGIEKFGTYTKSGVQLHLKLGDGSETLPFKIISCDGSELKTDYRDGDTHNNFTYGL